MELWDTMSEDDVLINEVLVQKGYALQCDEPYMSTVGLVVPLCAFHLHVAVFFSSQLARCQALTMEHAKAQAALKRRMEGREEEEQREEEVVPTSSTTTTVEWVSCGV